MCGVFGFETTHSLILMTPSRRGIEFSALTQKPVPTIFRTVKGIRNARKQTEATRDDVGCGRYLKFQVPTHHSVSSEHALRNFTAIVPIPDDF